MSLQTNTEGSNEEFVAARVYNLLIAANASFYPIFSHLNHTDSVWECD